ncbi:hypothetical protein B0H63DRAFT_452341 [Podospora didyma]|uniref:Uncharacterized protein n=1 Tax=Podospora didyma TaxID=330526 RepID=A0AAE0KKS9_9PEZI|nr:hypothetical protein B0H63DRAFT_452341 [Podospora didyma]
MERFVWIFLMISLREPGGGGGGGGDMLGYMSIPVIGTIQWQCQEIYIMSCSMSYVVCPGSRKEGQVGSQKLVISSRQVPFPKNERCDVGEILGRGRQKDTVTYGWTTANIRNLLSLKDFRIGPSLLVLFIIFSDHAAYLNVP